MIPLTTFLVQHGLISCVDLHMVSGSQQVAGTQVQCLIQHLLRVQAEQMLAVGKLQGLPSKLC